MELCPENGVMAVGRSGEGGGDGVVVGTEEAGGVDFSEDFEGFRVTVCAGKGGKVAVKFDQLVSCLFVHQLI